MLIKAIKSFESFIYGQAKNWSEPLESLLVLNLWVQHLSRQNCNYISAHGDLTSVRGLELPRNTCSLYKSQLCLSDTI